MSSQRKYANEIRLALREGKGEINSHYRRFLDLMSKDENLSPKEAALLEDKVVSSFREYKAKLQEVLKAEYPKISDVSIKHLQQLQQSLELSEEDIESVTDSCLSEIKGFFENKTTSNMLRNHLLFVGGTIAVGGVVVVAFPALSISVATATAAAAVNSFVNYQIGKRKDNEVESKKAELKVKKEFFDKND